MMAKSHDQPVEPEEFSTEPEEEEEGSEPEEEEEGSEPEVEEEVSEPEEAKERSESETKPLQTRASHPTKMPTPALASGKGELQSSKPEDSSSHDEVSESGTDSSSHSDVSESETDSNSVLKRPDPIDKSMDDVRKTPIPKTSSKPDIYAPASPAKYTPPVGTKRPVLDVAAASSGEAKEAKRSKKKSETGVESSERKDDSKNLNDLNKKFQNNSDKERKGEEMVSAHEQICYKLSKRIWGKEGNREDDIIETSKVNGSNTASKLAPTSSEESVEWSKGLHFGVGSSTAEDWIEKIQLHAKRLELMIKHAKSALEAVKSSGH